MHRAPVHVEAEIAAERCGDASMRREARGSAGPPPVPTETTRRWTLPCESSRSAAWPPCIRIFRSPHAGPSGDATSMFRCQQYRAFSRASGSRAVIRRPCRLFPLLAFLLLLPARRAPSRARPSPNSPASSSLPLSAAYCAPRTSLSTAFLARSVLVLSPSQPLTSPCLPAPSDSPRCVLAPVGWHPSLSSPFRALLSRLLLPTPSWSVSHAKLPRQLPSCALRPPAGASALTPSLSVHSLLLLLLVLHSGTAALLLFILLLAAAMICGLQPLVLRYARRVQASHVAPLRSLIPRVGTWLFLLQAAWITGSHAQQLAPCRVTKIEPGGGPPTGGTPVTIIGNNFTSTFTFVSSHTYCKWGSTGELVKPTFVSATRIICLSPPSASVNPEKVVLYVTNDGGYTFSTDIMSYFYDMQEVVTALEPSVGPEYGSTLVRVHGQGFRRLPQLSCMFGSTIVSGSWMSDYVVECLSIAMPAGSQVDVRIANNGVDFSTSSAPFAFKGLVPTRRLRLLPFPPPTILHAKFSASIPLATYTPPPSVASPVLRL
jgi:hypothetical protein